MQATPLFKLVNVFHYQAGWFACVLGAGHGLPWLGPALVGLFVAIDLALAADPARQAAFIVAAAGAGFLTDSLQVLGGAFTFLDPMPYPWMSPPWMVALWAIFATLFHSALSWLRGRYVLGAILGAVGGPLAYYAGAALGPILLGTNLARTLATIAIAWALATPLLLWLFARIGPSVHPPAVQP